MTGLEMLKQEMLKRGCTKAQTESKLVAIVLDIVSEAGTAYTDLREAEERMKEINNAEAALRKREKALGEAKEKFRDETEDYVEDFRTILRNCETAKTRDALKVAQMFTDSINIKCAYDNTAYINGLAMILCGQEIPAPIALRRVEEPSRVSARY